MSRAAIYARLSSNRNGEKSDTLTYQKERSHQIAETEGWEVVATLSDNDLSGASTKGRNDYQRLKDLVASKAIDVVVVQATDRLFRDTREGGVFRDSALTMT